MNEVNIPDSIYNYWEKNTPKDCEIKSIRRDNNIIIFYNYPAGKFTPPRIERALAWIYKDKPSKFKVNNTWYNEEDAIRVIKLISFT